MMRNLAFEKRYPHPPGKVWKALVTSEALAEWLMPNDFEPVAGRVFRFSYPGDDCGQESGIVFVEIEQITPPDRMVWLWRNADQGETTRVVFSLEPLERGTILLLDMENDDSRDILNTLRETSCIEEINAVKGFNYSKGDKVDISILRSDVCTSPDENTQPSAL